jgi:hypothetical protein
MTDHEIDICVEEMIRTWLDYNNMWAAASDGPEAAVFDRSYVTQAQPQYLMNLEQLVVHVHLWLNDELNSAQLLGVFDVEDAPPEMRFLSAEVDTSWRDFWAKDGPEGKFLNTP